MIEGSFEEVLFEELLLTQIETLRKLRDVWAAYSPYVAPFTTRGSRFVSL